MRAVSGVSGDDEQEEKSEQTLVQWVKSCLEPTANLGVGTYGGEAAELDPNDSNVKRVEGYIKSFMTTVLTPVKTPRSKAGRAKSDIRAGLMMGLLCCSSTIGMGTETALESEDDEGEEQEYFSNAIPDIDSIVLFCDEESAADGTIHEFSWLKGPIVVITNHSLTISTMNRASDKKSLKGRTIKHLSVTEQNLRMAGKALTGLGRGSTACIVRYEGDTIGDKRHETMVIAAQTTILSWHSEFDKKSFAERTFLVAQRVGEHMVERSMDDNTEVHTNADIMVVPVLPSQLIHTRMPNAVLVIRDGKFHIPVENVDGMSATFYSTEQRIAISKWVRANVNRAAIMWISCDLTPKQVQREILGKKGEDRIGQAGDTTVNQAIDAVCSLYRIQQ